MFGNRRVLLPAEFLSALPGERRIHANQNVPGISCPQNSEQRTQIEPDTHIEVESAYAPQPEEEEEQANPKHDESPASDSLQELGEQWITFADHPSGIVVDPKAHKKTEAKNNDVGNGKWPPGRHAPKRCSEVLPVKRISHPEPPSALFEEDASLDLLNRVGDLDTSWACLGAVEDRPAPPHTELLVKNGEALLCCPVTGIEEEPVCIDNGSRPKPLGRPENRTGGGATGAEDALRRVVVECPLFRRLQALTNRWWFIIDEIRHDGSILSKERLHVDDEITDDSEAQEGLDRDLWAEILDEHLTGEPVPTINTHRIGTADAVRATPTKSERSVLVPLDVIERIEDAIGRLDLDSVLTIVGLRVGLGIEPLDTQCHLHVSTPAPSARTG